MLGGDGDFMVDDLEEVKFGDGSVDLGNDCCFGWWGGVWGEVRGEVDEGEDEVGGGYCDVGSWFSFKIVVLILWIKMGMLVWNFFYVLEMMCWW